MAAMGVVPFAVQYTLQIDSTHHPLAIHSRSTQDPTLTLAPSHLPFGDFINYEVKPLLSYAEICRRAMWSLFRVENEHLNSTLAYKSAAVVPLHFERGAPPRPPEDPKEGPSYLAVALEVSAFIAAVLTCYVLSYVTHS